MYTFEYIFKWFVLNTDIDECGSSPCENAGTCIDRVNGFDCNCPAGFRGVLCEISKEISSSLISSYRYQQ